MSFIFSQNAIVRYNKGPPTTVVKEAYMKKRRTLFAFMPSVSAKRVETAKPCFSKK